MITPSQASLIGHGELPFHNPIAASTIGELIDLLALEPTDRVLDVGCGRGELLIQVAERTGAGGLGIDLSEPQIAVAREQAAARVPSDHLLFEARDAGALVASAGSYAVAACIGSTHALGGLEATLDRLVELVRPGGYLVLGEGYWLRLPEREALDLLGATTEELTDFSTLLAAGARRELELVYVATADHADWNRYEWTYVFNLDRFAGEHLGEAGIEVLRGRAERMRRRRLLAADEGETLGFALVAWRLR